MAVPKALGSAPLTSPVAVFSSLWHNRVLVLRLAQRDVLARYRGSLLGLLWSFLHPLVLLATFTFVFGTVLRSRWPSPVEGHAEFALVLFAGLLVFWLFSDCASRAPDLLLQNEAYIKKVVFPLEVLPWVALLSALFHTAVSAVVLVGFHTLVKGPPPPTACLLPVALLPVALLALGATWFLASLAVYVRDVAQVVPVLVTLLLFLSPLFYPLEALPEALRPLLYANPLTLAIGHARDLLLWGTVPPAWEIALASGLGWLAAWLGLLWFRTVRRGFADVV